MVTQELLKSLFHYDPENGVFTYLVKRKNSKEVGEVAGCRDSKGYLTIHIGGKNHRAHRLAWLYVHGTFPKYVIDHKNRIRTDNRISNLRVVTVGENQHNKTPPKNLSSGIEGITWSRHRRRWVAYVSRYKVKYNLGGYRTVQQAMAVRHKFMIENGFYEQD